MFPDKTVKDLLVEVGIKNFKTVILKGDNPICPFRQIVHKSRISSSEEYGGQVVGRGPAQFSRLKEHLKGNISYFTFSMFYNNKYLAHLNAPPLFFDDLNNLTCNRRGITLYHFGSFDLWREKDLLDYGLQCKIIL